MPQHSASLDSFRTSLDELLSWDWDGAALVVEHCDSESLIRPVEKGFLSFEKEVIACQEFGIGMLINWGRSAIDTHDPATPLEQIRRAREANILSGVMFSGAAPVETEYGYAWIDGHLPSSEYEPQSLMTPERIRACADAALSAEYAGGAAKYLGAKMCVPADASLQARISMIQTVYKDALK